LKPSPRFLLLLALMRQSDAAASPVEIVASDCGPQAVMFVAIAVLLCERADFLAHFAVRSF
jgi:hypothetical protein